MISLKNALKEMRRKDEHGRFVPFTIEAVKCNYTKRTGGELVRYDGVTLPKRDGVILDTNLRASGERNPRHLQNGTMNLMLPNKELRKVHTLLITKFNGETVI